MVEVQLSDVQRINKIKYKSIVLQKDSSVSNARLECKIATPLSTIFYKLNWPTMR